MHYLSNQVGTTKKWLTMLKTHMVMHRLLTGGGDEFKAQVQRLQKAVAEERGRDSREKNLFAIRNWHGTGAVQVVASPCFEGPRTDPACLVYRYLLGRCRFTLL